MKIIIETRAKSDDIDRRYVMPRINYITEEAFNGFWLFFN